MCDVRLNNIVIPTDELMGEKNADIKMLMCMSLISNVENSSKRGGNVRYCTIKKLNKHIEELSGILGVDRYRFITKLNRLLKFNSDEFLLTERMFDGEEVSCYEINYKSGKFVNIDYRTFEKLLIQCNKTEIKTYISLLWMCNDKGKRVEKTISQDYLLSHLGLSSNSKKQLKRTTDNLEQLGFIKTKKVWKIETQKIGNKLKQKPKCSIIYNVC